jgi:hypothetical protein
LEGTVGGRWRMRRTVNLAAAEAHLATAMASVEDPQGDRLLRREASDVLLITEARHLLAHMVAAALFDDLAKIVEGLRAAHKVQPGGTEPDWERVAHALAWTAMRRAEVAVTNSVRMARDSQGEGS